MTPLRDEIAEIIASFTGLNPTCFTVAVGSQRIVELIHKRLSEGSGYDFSQESVHSKDNSLSVMSPELRDVLTSLW